MKNREKILWITRTAVLIALLVALQWATSSLGQFVTGSCVNAVLAVAALYGGLWCGAVVALVSPFCAFLVGVGPALIQIVPFIALGNLAFAIMLHYTMGGKSLSVITQAVCLALSAVAKFVVLYVGVVHVFIPLMGGGLKAPQIATFTTMFSWPQLVTALIGGTVALLILPVLKKALKK